MSKRLAVFHDEFPAGGAERVTADIAEYITRHGWEVTLFVRKFNAGWLPGGKLDNMTPVILPDPVDSWSEQNALFMIDTINLMGVRVLLNPVKGLDTLLSKRDMIPGCKIVFAMHCSPFWEASVKEHRVRARAGRSLGARMKFIFLDYLKYFVLKAHLRRFVAMDRMVYDSVDAYTVICEGYRRTMAKAFRLDPSDNRLVAINNCERPVADPNLRKERQVLYVGRLNRVDKRVDRLLEIWAKVAPKAPDWELVIVGDGEDGELLRRMAASMRLERVRFEGYRANTGDYYRSAAISVLTSAYEGWGLVLTEAQANGVVPIAFGCSDGVREILAPDGVNGVIVPPFSKKKFARSLLRLMADDGRRADMQRNALRKSHEYSPEVVGAKWKALFESLSQT